MKLKTKLSSKQKVPMITTATPACDAQKQQPVASSLSKMQKFEYIQETAELLCSKRPLYEKIKKQMQNIRSTYEFENAVPYLRAIANLYKKRL